MKFPDEDLLVKIMPKNAGAHNSIYRGKDITDLFFKGDLSRQIADQTFDDIFIGDYIMDEKHNKYLVAHINYRLETGDNKLGKPHVLMIPETPMDTSAMNGEATAVGAYANSRLKTAQLDTFRNKITNFFGESHILTHRNYLCNKITNGYESGGSWVDTNIDLMNELMVYGTNLFHNNLNGTANAQNSTIDKTQLALFRLRPDLITCGISWWLRDIASSTEFCAVYQSGTATKSPATYSYGIRPAFLLV